jgi:cardiolipin synthase (CMP-forming)
VVSLLNIPNILTAIRFILVPIFGYYLYIEQYSLAISLFLLSGLTDVLDGYIARKFDMITSFGKLADPIADKLMQITALVFLTINIPRLTPVLIIVLAKEIFMGLGSISLYRKKNTIVSADWYGKLATVIFYFAIIVTILLKKEFINLPYTEEIVNVLIGIAVISTLFAFFMYSIMYRNIKKK